MSQNYRELPKKNFIETRDLLLEQARWNAPAEDGE